MKYIYLYIPIYLYILDIKLVYICIKIYSILIKLSYVRYLNKNVNSSSMHNSGVLYLYRCYDDSVTNKCKTQLKQSKKQSLLKKVINISIKHMRSFLKNDHAILKI